MAKYGKANAESLKRGGPRSALLLAIALIWLGATASAQVPPGCEDCPPTAVQVESFSGAQSQDGHLLRDTNASTCGGKAFPGVVGTGTSFFYETVTYRNSGPSACVSVVFDPTAGGAPCGTNAQVAAYQGTYDPFDQAAGYLGDRGSSTTGSFSFQAPADSDFVIAVTNSTVEDTCSYSLQVVDVPCQTDSSLCELVTAVPSTDLRGQVGLMLLLALAGAFFLRRFV